MSTSADPKIRGTFPLPVRGLKPGLYPFLVFLPGALDSPAMGIIGTDCFPAASVIPEAKVRLVSDEGFCWVDETAPCIVLADGYYQTGSDLDLYLDLLHEVTHIRQILEGRDVWDEAFPYHRRPTEIEGFAVAVSECRRLGLDENSTREHLHNPWMTAAHVSELMTEITAFLSHPRRS
jgi:hypothetical protein